MAGQVVVWTCFTEAEIPFWTRLLKRPDTGPALAGLEAAIASILPASPKPRNGRSEKLEPYPHLRTPRMTKMPTVPPEQQQLMEELEAIGRRIGPGGITAEEADALTAEAMQRFNRRVVDNVDAQLAGARRTRRRWVAVATGLLLAAAALVLLR
jgi:hypothetical protein